MKFKKKINPFKRDMAFFKGLKDLLTDPVFLFITLLGNAAILVCGTFFFIFETDSNDTVQTWFDAIYWGFTTITTVGYGDVVAETVGGKITSVFLMVVGTGIFWAYTGLFVSMLVSRVDRNKRFGNVHYRGKGNRNRVGGSDGRNRHHHTHTGFHENHASRTGRASRTHHESP